MNYQRIWKLALILLAIAVEPLALVGQQLGDQPLLVHLAQEDIDAGRTSFEQIFTRGAIDFGASFNKLDGFGDPRRAESFNRRTGPDSQSCFECHNRPALGGAGGAIASIILGNVRNPRSVLGDGVLQRLGEEMTADLQAIRDAALSEARSTGHSVTRDLITKDVNFGEIAAAPSGRVITNRVQGVDSDLVVKPFGWKGDRRTLRDFALFSTAFHHGMQAVERVGRNVDADGDGVVNELTEGDVTALTIWMAFTPIPQEITSDNPAIAAAVASGEQLFTTIGCANCHRPNLTIQDPVFREPSPLDKTKVFARDLTDPRFAGPVNRIAPRPERTPQGGALAHIYSDLKRHTMGPGLAEHGNSIFMSAPLWGVSQTGPWLHDGRATTLKEAILAHGGEAQEARDSFANLPAGQQDEVVEFLKSLVAK
ncbi:MAG: hypothetical protein HY314_03060 [Acidobacteria bacterium]|nr:hypothetical protein [Acidobacteriota bacterium]